MEFKEFEYNGMTIVISDGGCSIIGDGWDLTLPSETFDSVVEEHGLNELILKDEMIKYYKNFFKK